MLLIYYIRDSVWFHFVQEVCFIIIKETNIWVYTIFLQMRYTAVNWLT